MKDRLQELTRQSAEARAKLLDLIEQQKQTTSCSASPSISPIPPHSTSPHAGVCFIFFTAITARIILIPIWLRSACFYFWNGLQAEPYWTGNKIYKWFIYNIWHELLIKTVQTPWLRFNDFSESPDLKNHQNQVIWKECKVSPCQHQKLYFSSNWKADTWSVRVRTWKSPAIVCQDKQTVGLMQTNESAGVLT